MARPTRFILVFFRFFLLGLLLAGCTIGPDYLRPADNVPAAFSVRPGTAPMLATTPWWLSFGDATLNRLVDDARLANPDLARARAGVAEARAALAQARAGGTLQLDATAGASYGRSFQAPGYYSRPTGYVTQGFDASWELDLWGRNARTVQAAAANADAVQADADGAMLSLLGEVARAYVALRGTQAQIGTARVSIDNQKRANELAHSRFDGGDGTRLEVLQGQTLLMQQQAQLPVLDAQVQVLIHALSALCGEPPDALSAALSTAAPIPQAPVPDAGIPADLIRRRPDVRAAERRLAAGIALVGAAMAEKYPSLRLSGSLTFSGSALGSIMSTPLFALAPTLTLPLLDGGQREAVVDMRRAQAEQARLGYRSEVLRALREVEDAMAQLRGETLHRDQLKLTVGSARKVVETARNLYALGATDFLQVLDSQRVLNQSLDALVQAEAARSIQAVALFKALAGGWQAGPDPEL
jgi:multidrug efflux system outer membrane protein